MPERIVHLSEFWMRVTKPNQTKPELKRILNKRFHWLSAHLGSTADQSHAPDWVRSLPGIRVLQTKKRPIEGVGTQVGFPVHRKVVYHAVHRHQPVRHASKHSGQVLTTD